MLAEEQEATIYFSKINMEFMLNSDNMSCWKCQQSAKNKIILNKAENGYELTMIEMDTLGGCEFCSMRSSKRKCVKLLLSKEDLLLFLEKTSNIINKD